METRESASGCGVEVLLHVEMTVGSGAAAIAAAVAGQGEAAGFFPVLLFLLCAVGGSCGMSDRFWQWLCPDTL